MPDSPTQRTPAETYILGELEVYNWGPFCNRHRVDIHPQGTAIIGTTASGKTTLIDALMTLLTKTPRYNLASTGGHESDRDLSSYVRGVHGDGSNEGDQQRHIRRGRTVTGLCARFVCGKKSVQLGAIFWFDGQSSAASDRKNLWFFCERNDQSLEQWLTLHHDGGVRAINKYARDTAGLSVTNTKTKYLAQVRRFFEVSENAFSLLNRAAGLKQLNNINEIFRDYVLEDHSAFERAAQVVTEFNDLAAIREELEVARRQQQSLVPVLTVHQKFISADKRLAQHKELLHVLPIWFARCGAKLWAQHFEELGQKIEQFEHKSAALKTSKRDIKQQEDRLNEIYIAAGGGKVSQLKEQLEQINVTLKLRQETLREYQKLVKKLRLDDTPTREALKLNQQQAVQTQTQLLEQKTACREAIYDHGANLKVAESACGTLKKEIQKIIARPGSNVPGQFQDFRADLADALNMSEAALPFVAELVEIKPEEQDWRGAIERALGAHRLR
ncbi:MAG: ATP-binding protein, partial [Gammaproteobacteria bacterium]